MNDAVSCQDLKKNLSKFYIIDVREDDEYKEGYVKGAVHIPLGKLIRDEGLGIVPRNKKIVVYCRSGLRGSMAQKFLEERGYDVLNLEGGYRNFKENK